MTILIDKTKAVEVTIREWDADSVHYVKYGEYFTV